MYLDIVSIYALSYSCSKDTWILTKSKTILVVIIGQNIAKKYYFIKYSIFLIYIWKFREHQFIWLLMKASRPLHQKINTVKFTYPQEFGSPNAVTLKEFCSWLEVKR